MATAFDPAAATAAWLARIPSGQRVAAQAAMDWRLAAWVGGGLIIIGLCVLVARNNTLGVIRQRIESKRPQPWLSAAALSAAMALVLLAAAAMIGGLTDWRAEQILNKGGGFPAPAGFDVHVAEAASGLPLGVLAVLLLVPPTFWLMRRRPRTWPLIAGALAAVAILGLGWLPDALGATPALSPAPPGPAEAAVAALIAETHLPAQGVLAWPNAGLDADVIGGFGQAKVILGPAMLAAPPDQARAYVGHLMGHYVHGDVLVVCLIAAATITLGFFAMQRWAAPLAGRIGRRPVASAADPEALPALAIIGFLALTAASLAAGAYLRFANVGADAYSLDHARAPDALVSVLERQWDHAATGANPVEAAIFYTHPPLESRIAHAMAWKAAHGG